MNPRLIPRQDAAPFMTNRSEIQPTRRLACASCGAEFGCNLSGPCWCMDEAYRLPIPSDGGDCLCPDCLRKAAARAADAAAT
jgi:hypothetical protein